jgi:hypothetical protein
MLAEEDLDGVWTFYKGGPPKVSDPKFLLN